MEEIGKVPGRWDKTKQSFKEKKMQSKLLKDCDDDVEYRLLQCKTNPRKTDRSRAVQVMWQVETNSSTPYSKMPKTRR